MFDFAGRVLGRMADHPAQLTRIVGARLRFVDLGQLVVLAADPIHGRLTAVPYAFPQLDSFTPRVLHDHGCSRLRAGCSSVSSSACSVLTARTRDLSSSV